ncbi:hypothetical protein TNIN_311271 [Trichonephila inaurata madagascariensis]|uniref:Uncharacterized protein n=1 Tax=Trichonephila inaurata madagascariensis TaxID=2747483 RepID=A0A8X6WYB3_9ARAC|nr:hypothetical protein TNIN_311271 [Trichonephila inaurata madagascariensis]
MVFSVINVKLEYLYFYYYRGDNIEYIICFLKEKIDEVHSLKSGFLDINLFLLLPRKTHLLTMSTKQPSNAFDVTYSENRNGSSFNSFAKNPPEEKKPSTSRRRRQRRRRLSNKVLKSTFKAYLLYKWVRNDIISTRKEGYHTSLLILDKNFEYVVNTSLVKALLERYFRCRYFFPKPERLMKILLQVYTELCSIRKKIKVDYFFFKEMKTFINAPRRRKLLELKWIFKCPHKCLSCKPLKKDSYKLRKPTKPIIKSDAPINMNQVVFELKYPARWKQLFKHPAMVINDPDESDSKSEKEISCVKAIEGGSFSRDREAVKATLASFMRPFSMPKLCNLIIKP